MSIFCPEVIQIIYNTVVCGFQFFYIQLPSEVLMSFCLSSAFGNI